VDPFLFPWNDLRRRLFGLISTDSFLQFFSKPAAPSKGASVALSCVRTDSADPLSIGDSGEVKPGNIVNHGGMRALVGAERVYFACGRAHAMSQGCNRKQAPSLAGSLTMRVDAVLLSSFASNGKRVPLQIQVSAAWDCPLKTQTVDNIRAWMQRLQENGFYVAIAFALDPKRGLDQRFKSLSSTRDSVGRKVDLPPYKLHWSRHEAVWHLKSSRQPRHASHHQARN